MQRMRTLYDCLNARYPDDVTHIDYIWCRKGHILGRDNIHKGQADREKPLICIICQTCRDFEPMNEEG